MMDGGMSLLMNSMMGWVMGIGVPGWVLVIALLATIVVLLARLLGRTDGRRERKVSEPDRSAPG